MEKKPNVKILVCCHKQDVCATEPPYFPIQVGKAISQVDLGIQGDDTGDNISHKNANYCELTGMYWAWKNLKDVDVIGLCHYRRYFDFHGLIKRPLDHIRKPSAELASTDLTIPDKIIDYVMRGGVIMSKAKVYPRSLEEDYCMCHVSDDFRALQHAIETTQPENLRRAFHVVMHKRCSLMHYNMFLMRWSNYDKYCQWLFDVLGEVEKVTDISHYSALQSRIYGYMAERLFNVWAYANFDHLKTYPVLQFTDDRKPTPSRLHLWINHTRYRIGRVLLSPIRKPEAEG